MKRRVISFIAVFALCMGMCPAWAATVENDPGPGMSYWSETDTTADETNVVSTAMRFDTCGCRYTVTGGAAFRVTGTGRLYLTTGTIESANGAGIEVQDGGFLRIENPDMSVIGTTYGLQFSPDAAAWLFGGTFTGGTAAVQAQNYAELLVTGYAYYDENGNVLLPDDVAGMKTVVVKECTGHVFDYDYTIYPDSPKHDWVCLACGTRDTNVPCSFSFDTDGNGECDYCGREIKIDIDLDPDSLVYDGTPMPDVVPVTVTLDGTKTLNAGTDYDVEYTTGTNAGDTVSVTVCSLNDDGESTEYINFTKTFKIIEDTPVISWDDTQQLDFDYKADKTALLSEIKDALLSHLNIIINAAGEDLSGNVKFLYRSQRDSGAGFTEGLPTNAGTYDVRADLPAVPNYNPASTGEEYFTLTISPISPEEDPPTARILKYDGTAQELVTHGSAPADAEIQFSRSGNDPWSKDVPTEINAGKYDVWYRVVDEANNYYVVEATHIDDVEIMRKKITPILELEYYTTVYDGGFKVPKVTVKDGDTVLPDSEYKVEYTNNQSAGKATVTVTDKDDGNYQILEATANFQITEKDQDGLNITGQPSVVTYGDVFILGTSGGSGNGTTTWEILPNEGAGGEEDTPSTVAKVDEMSGQVTVTGHGTATVRAKRTGPDYKEATADWTFTANKKHAVATVTAKNKTYDANDIATVNAVVDRSYLAFPEDTISIAVTGKFSDKNAGTGIEVTVDTNNAQISGNDDGNYDITYSSTTVTADIYKAATIISTPPRTETPTYKKDTPQKLIVDNTAAAAPEEDNLTAGEDLEVEYALSRDGTYSTAIPTGTDAGEYEVWYRVKEGKNFAGTTAERLVVTIARKYVPSPVIELDNDYNYTFDGSPKEPAVTVKDGEDVIPDSEYDVTYGNNVNVGENTATVTVKDRDGGNYNVGEGTVNFTISKGNSAVLTGRPQAKNLTYNGEYQELVTAGAASGGELLYALKGESGNAPSDTEYTDEIPLGKNAGEYTVYYMVKGDSNHDDTTPEQVTVTIKPKQVVNPVITLDIASAVYTGSGITPGVTVKDGNTLIAFSPDPDKDSEYTVEYRDNINVGTATVLIINSDGGNYIVNGSATFEIRKAVAAFNDDGEPAANALEYTGSAQELVSAGDTDDGNAAYSPDGVNYSLNIPKGTDAGKYTVWYKVIGDSNHTDSAPKKVEVTIAPKTVAQPQVSCSPDVFTYDGKAKMPEITVYDGNIEIPAGEYTVDISRKPSQEASEPEAAAAFQPAVEVGFYTLTVTDKSDSGGNYKFTMPGTADFEIAQADQTSLSIVTDKPETVHYGDTFKLGTTGGSGSGEVVWDIDEAYADIAEVDADGVVTVKGVDAADGFIVTAYKKTDGSYKESNKASKVFLAGRRPVTPTITVADKTYDKTTSATLTAIWKDDDFVFGDNITVTVKGEFESADAGTGKRIVNIELNASGANFEKYDITPPAKVTGDIKKANAKITPPEPKEGLAYTGERQAIVAYDPAEDDIGIVKFHVGDSKDGDYSTVIPTASNAGKYTVWYKVDANNNWNGTDPVELEPVTIDKAEVKIADAPKARTGLVYSPGTQHELVEAGATVGGIGVLKYSLSENGAYSTTIPKAGNAGTYNVYYKVEEGTNWKGAEGTAPVTVKIDPAKAAIAAYPEANTGMVYSPGKQYELVTGGTTVGGIGVLKYSLSEDGTYSTVVPRAGNAGKYTVWYKVDGGDNWEGVPADKVEDIEIEKAKAAIAAYPEAETGLVYSPGKQHNLITGGTTVGGMGVLKYSLSEDGTYSTVVPRAGNAGEYTVWYKVDGTDNWEGVPAAEMENKITIERAPTEVDPKPEAIDNIIYDGQPHALVSEGAAKNGIGVVKYHLGETSEGTYSTIIPKATNVGTYKVWYRIEEGTNWLASEEYDPVVVTISSGQQSGGSAGTSGTSSAGSGTSAANKQNTESISAQTSVSNGTASTVLTASAGNELVNRAVADKSTNIVIRPEITGDVTKAEVSIPASAVSRIKNETDAALTVSTPIADVTIPNAALDTLSGAGGAVSVATEKVENTVVLTLTANGNDAGEIPGGLTLTVPAEDAGPGTVAVLVYEDGTREIVRKSVAENGEVRIPLEGSATVEIVDNGKEFADVPAEGWAADAVAFASSHELFNGTGEATFSPENPMSRAMLATVLYNLDGNPDRGLTDVFSDISSGDWYAPSVSWAAANGIIGGYGDGQFGPDDSVTREQFAVMLWRYAGSPAADEQTLDFTDADRASSYAVQALCWAAANGILSGYGDGQLDPGGQATRAQAAQVLRKFIENI